MNAMNASQWIFAATVIVAAVFIMISLARLIRTDGYSHRTAPDPRADWGTPTRPSVPFSSRI